MKKNLPATALFTVMVICAHSQTNTFPATGSAGLGHLNVDAWALAAGAYDYSLFVDGKLIATRQMERLSTGRCAK